MAESIRYYADVHVPASVTRALRRRGVDVLTAQDVGMAAASDDAHLARATADGRVLISQDADFLVLHAGIAYAAQGTAIGRMVNGLLLMFDVLTPEEMIDWIEFL